MKTDSSVVGVGSCFVIFSQLQSQYLEYENNFDLLYEIKLTPALCKFAYFYTIYT